MPFHVRSWSRLLILLSPDVTSTRTKKRFSLVFHFETRTERVRAAVRLQTRVRQSLVSVIIAVAVSVAVCVQRQSIKILLLSLSLSLSRFSLVFTVEPCALLMPSREREALKKSRRDERGRGRAGRMKDRSNVAEREFPCPPHQ